MNTPPPPPLFKRLWNRYGTFCEGIEKILGEPQAALPAPVSLTANITQLLEEISGVFKAGFIVTSFANESRIKSYFAPDEFEDLGRVLAAPFNRFIPVIKSAEDLKPIPLNIEILADRILREGHLDPAFERDVIYHFWLLPEQSLSLVVVFERKNWNHEEIRNVFLKTQSLIQRRFYD